MPKRMLIDAVRPEETRVVVADGVQLEDYDVALAARPQIKGNIYLAKVVRVEASLQAAFVDYGHEKHGFLSFTEIHPDYFQIPVADREAIIARDSELARQEAEAEELGDENLDDLESEDAGEEPLAAGAEEHEEEKIADDEPRKDRARRRPNRRRSERQRRAELYRNYRIQEVIRNGQLILVQATKEQRGTKGAVFSSYISLPGRYTVLMPNTPHGGGVSRKIASPDDRKRLRKIVKELELAEGMSVILRTAAKGHTRTEIRRDFDYIVAHWSDIRDKTLNSVGASIVHKENDLVKRAIRDLYQSDIDEVIVAGDTAYKRAKEITRKLSPSKARHVKLYRGDLPFFHSYGIERPLSNIHRPEVRLPSGGSMVMNQTEALVTVDINSGRAIRERHIEETALKTNLEAVDELARQFRLRDLAGLIVIDFIGMERRRNNEQVEQRLKEALKHDRARTHVGHMSGFGLIEMSRQRLRASIRDTQHEACTNCHGHGWIYRPEAHAMMVIRALECEVANYEGCRFRALVPPACAKYLTETMWRSVHQLETQFEVRIDLQPTSEPLADNYLLEVIRADGSTVPLNPTVTAEQDTGSGRQGERARRGTRGKGTSPGDSGTEERRARRASPVSLSESDQEEEEERRPRGRGARSASRRGHEDEAQEEKVGGRNGRRRPSTRADYDEDAESDLPSSKRRARSVSRDAFEDDPDNERASRRRNSPAAARNGHDDEPTDDRRQTARPLASDDFEDEPDQQRRRDRQRTRPLAQDDANDEAAEARRTRRRQPHAQVDGDDEEPGDDLQSRERRRSAARDEYDEEDELPRGRRRRSRAAPRDDHGDDGVEERRSRRASARSEPDEDVDDMEPERPRARRRRALSTARADEAVGATEERGGRRRRARPEVHDDEAAGATEERGGRRRRARPEVHDDEAVGATEERGGRRRRARPEEVHDDEAVGATEERGGRRRRVRPEVHDDEAVGATEERDGRRRRARPEVHDDEAAGATEERGGRRRRARPEVHDDEAAGATEERGGRRRRARPEVHDDEAAGATEERGGRRRRAQPEVHDDEAAGATEERGGRRRRAQPEVHDDAVVERATRRRGGSRSRADERDRRENGHTLDADLPTPSDEDLDMPEARVPIRANGDVPPENDAESPFGDVSDRGLPEPSERPARRTRRGSRGGSRRRGIRSSSKETQSSNRAQLTELEDSAVSLSDPEQDSDSAMTAPHANPFGAPVESRGPELPAEATEFSGNRKHPFGSSDNSAEDASPRAAAAANSADQDDPFGAAPRHAEPGEPDSTASELDVGTPVENPFAGPDPETSSASGQVPDQETGDEGGTPAEGAREKAPRWWSALRSRA